jgi:5-methyltetrahydrofolate--homocysteine methyltransferase
MNSFLNALEQRVLVLDGAMGTMLQERGLAPGASPEAMNLESPEVVAAVHQAYAEAGADIIVTNTFGGNRVKLSHYQLENRVEEINARGIELARRAAPHSFIAGSIGPTGRFLEPVGDAGFDEMVEVFGEQVRAFAVAGADLITLETFLDIRELRAAVVACKEFSDLPVVAQMTFDDGGRSVLGTPPEAAAVTLDALGVDVVGSNCGLGPEGIHALLEKMRAVTALPLISQANAGLPQLVGDQTVFPAGPEDMTVLHDRLIALGVRIIGGCCGTTPEHIRAIHAALEGRDQTWIPPARGLYLSSRGTVVPIGGEAACAIIGERINPTGKKGYAAELREGKTAYIRREAQEQTEAGAVLLDVNCGAPGVDEPLSLERAVFAVNGVSSAPLVLDSSDPEALERGLKAADGKVLINSVNGERKSLEAVLPLARKYGAAVIGLALDEEGIPADAEGRVSVARAILDAALQAGLPARDVVIDALVLTVSAEQKGAVVTLEALRRIRQELGLATVLGVSNISYGLPDRPVLSSVFFAMALQAGLDAAIVNPKEERMMDAFRGAMVLLGRDLRAEEYIAHYGSFKAPPRAPQTEGRSLDIRAQLAAAIIEGDSEGAPALVRQAFDEGLTAMQISNEGLLPGLEEVGRRFGEKQIFLPQVMLSADTMHAAFDVIKERMQGEAGPSSGKILMATVEGDIHDIGKNIVCTLLENHGFEVIDLGKNVPADRIVEAALRHKVDAVGLSALMTTTLARMEETLERLRQEGVKVFTMVGGAVVTEDYAARIGADLYGGDAMDAVRKIKQILVK